MSSVPLRVDIRFYYADGKRALIAIEKGPPGERGFSEAFAAWAADSRRRALGIT
jgi:hypothetical protein